MKAYQLSCIDPDHGMTIRFAHRGRELRGRRTDNCDCEFIDLRVARAPKFDQYAPGPVTISQYLSQGWYWCCCRCERQIFDDSTPIVLDAADLIFCSRDCMEKSLMLHPGNEWHESILAMKRAIEREIERMDRGATV